MQANGAAHVDFIGRNADFRAEAKFETVGKAGGGVYHHAGAVDRAQKSLCTGEMFGNDAVGMVAAVGIDMGNGFIKAVDDRIEISAAKSGDSTPSWVRPVIAIGLTLLGVAVSTFGLTGLIAKGYGTLTWLFLAIYVLPLMTWGVWLLRRGRVRADPDFHR